jgi:hypothetical protein
MLLRALEVNGDFNLERNDLVDAGGDGLVVAPDRLEVILCVPHTLCGYPLLVLQLQPPTPMYWRQGRSTWFLAQ